MFIATRMFQIESTLNKVDVPIIRLLVLIKHQNLSGMSLGVALSTDTKGTYI